MPLTTGSFCKQSCNMGLPVEDRFRVAQAGEHDACDNIADKSIITRHSVEQDGQFEILNQRGFVRRQRLLRIEIPVAIEQEGLHVHDFSRSIRRS